MIQIERRLIVTENHKIALGDVERLLATTSEHDALYAMLPTLKTEWGARGDTSTCTSFTSALGEKLTLVVMPPLHPSVSQQREDDEYHVEVENEAGYRVDRNLKLARGRQRYSLDDCGQIAIAVHRLMVESEAAPRIQN